MRKKAALLFLLCVLAATPAWATKTYTDPVYLYSVDYPDTWREKNLGKVANFLSPFESKEDKFSENVTIEVRSLKDVPGATNLLDYHRQAISEAPDFLRDFKLLEEAKTKFAGKDAIAVLYTATVKGQLFRFKDYKFFVGKDIYILTFTALNEDFDTFLAAAEKIMRSLRVSP